MARHKAHILIAYTGGTIGMKRTPGGYKPEPNFLQTLMSDIPQFRAAGMPAFKIHAFDPLLDSSNMTPDDWVKIARVIRDNYAGYDGFLIVHGTDTMAFTSSALSFMLEDLGKPILITGSQIPLAETRNDAQGNLLTALMILGNYADKLSGVYLYFANKLLRGNRATKVNADGFEAFASPNLPPVGTVGINVEIDWELVLPPAQTAETVSVTEMGDATVAAFRLFPGIQAGYLNTLLAPPVQGVVLECFGAGNAPDKNRPFMEALETATQKHGVVIVDVTQPLRGSADLELYATGQALQKVGVVSGYDMTVEAALTKLFYLFGKGYGPAQVRKRIQENLRGELTPPAQGTVSALRRRLASFR